MKHKTTLEAYRLLQQGSEALSIVENSGIRVDRDFVVQSVKSISEQIKEIERKMVADKTVYPEWRKIYGNRVNLRSREQLARVVFEKMKYKSIGETATGRVRADKTALETVDLPFIKDFLEVEGLKTTRSTYLDGILREAIETSEGWWVHPVFNLNTVTTFRSSSQNPNFQNIPVRNPVIGELIRRCYYPSHGNHFVEVDYAQIEVRVAACYNHDPMLIKYIKDSSTDMHRDMAAQIFCLKPEQVAKNPRYVAKNRYVFPEFYGSVWFQCAPQLWDALTSVEGMNIRMPGDPEKKPTGISLKEHLKSKGIKTLAIVMVKDKETGRMKLDHDPKPGSFGNHLKKIEEDFWKNRFKVYDKWKQKWFEAYQRDGGFSMLTGFAVNGLLSRNDVINYPVQGAAFHCMLWSLIRIVNRLRRYKMKSKVIGEIHDSIQLDVVPKELDAVLTICQEIMTQDLPKAWKWIEIPLAVEHEVSPQDKSWFDKKVWVPGDHGWTLKV